MDILRAVGFWDAYNVTEDADLGLRLARAGYSVRTFRSYTREEAPEIFEALLAQRGRWLKGWMRLEIEPINPIDNRMMQVIAAWLRPIVATLSQQSSPPRASEARAGRVLGGATQSWWRSLQGELSAAVMG